MPSLNFETGLKTFDINGDPEKTVSFCPTDFNFIKRLYDVFSLSERLQTKYKGLLAADSDTEKAMTAILSVDKDIRKAIDSAFGEPVAEKAFGGLSSLAIAGGMPLWAGFLVAVISECDEGFVTQTTEVNPKLQQLLAKYKK